MAHATLYKTDTVSVATNSEEVFGRRDTEQRGSHRRAAAAAAAEKVAPDATIDPDGAPRPGSIMEPGSALASVVHKATGRARLHKIKGADKAVVDRVAVMQAPGNRGKKETKMSVTLRYNRNPIIGDKFSSRHGQKGVLSSCGRKRDLPYVERTGIRPDILINPHAFPSRMTIGMLVESMASKAGALEGNFVDASPFQAARDGDKFCPPVEEHGEVLRRHGYNYCGSETMVSGFTGEQFEVDIYIGLVYYQRLRHMVSDKFQVRSLGPNNPLTQQPIKGRKAGRRHSFWRDGARLSLGAWSGLSSPRPSPRLLRSPHRLPALTVAVSCTSGDSACHRCGGSQRRHGWWSRWASRGWEHWKDCL